MGYPVKDLVPNDNELGLVCSFGRVELGTVPTVIAVRQQASLVDFTVGLELSGPLPGVFATVRDNNVGAGCVLPSELLERSMD